MHFKISVRTTILHDYSGITVVNHPQAGGDQRGGRQGEVVAMATRGTGNVYIPADLRQHAVMSSSQFKGT